MRPTTTVRFRSQNFRPLRPEEDQVNPGVYGEELARWVATRLVESGSIEPRVDFEDFAWLVELPFGDATAWLLCANECGSDEIWMIDVREAPRFLGWVRRPKLPANELLDLCTKIHAILAAETGLSEIEWFKTGRSGQEEEGSPEPRF